MTKTLRHITKGLCHLTKWFYYMTKPLCHITKSFRHITKRLSWQQIQKIRQLVSHDWLETKQKRLAKVMIAILNCETAKNHELRDNLGFRLGQRFHRRGRAARQRISAQGIPAHPGGICRNVTAELTLPIFPHTLPPPMFEQAFKNIDDVLWKDAGCTSELDYTEQTSWLLFLKYLDTLESDKAMEAELNGKKYAGILDKQYRWESWAAPKGTDGKLDHNAAMTGDDLVAFDDPVSSLDSDVLFIVSNLIKGVFDEVRNGVGHIKQVFVLTHNVYFHKEITFSPQRGDGVKGEETFWVVRKHDQFSTIQKCTSNPIKTSYDLLWAEVRTPNKSNLTIQNTLRRILENYFKILGNLDSDDICAKFDGKEKLICKSLFSWVNDGSHSALDDLYISIDSGTVENYLKVFRNIFERTEHDAHYKMMMGSAFVESVPTPAAAETAAVST